MRRKEGDVYLRAAAPIEHKPADVYVINQVARKRVTFEESANFLMAGQVRVEHRSRRKETVSLQREEHYGCQLGCDRASSVKRDGNDIELNGETDDEDVEDEETDFDDGKYTLSEQS